MTWVGVVGALVVVLADIWVRAVRLQALLGGSLSVRDAIVVNQMGEAASAVTPARIGGEPVRFAELKRLQHQTPSIIAVLITERVVDWMLIGGVLITALAVGRGELIGLIGDRIASLRSPLWMMVGAILMISVVLSWWWAVRYRKRMATLLPLSDDASERPVQPIPRLVLATGLTAVSMALRTAVLPVIAWPMVAGHAGMVSLGSFVLLYSQTVLPTPSGAGIVEVGFVAGMGPLAGTATIASILLVWRVLTVGVGAMIGVLIFARRGARWSNAFLQPTARAESA